MRKSIHHHYVQLTEVECEFVDHVFMDVFKCADDHGVPLAGNDILERAVDALARAVIESRAKPKPTGIWPDWGDSPNGFDGPGGAE